MRFGFLASILSSICILLSCGEFEKPIEPYYFVQIADPQLGFNARNNSAISPDFSYESERYTNTINKINSLVPSPDFVVISGDLVNFKDSELQHAEFFRISSTLNQGITLYLVSGNHDVSVDNKPTKKDLSDYRERVGKDIFSFKHKNILGIVLNSTIISDPIKVPEEYDAQLKWFESVLKTNRQAQPGHMLVFQHHPYFLQNYDEDDEYYNIPKVRRTPYLDLLKKYNVSAVFSGHKHGGATPAPYQNTKMIVAPAVANKRPSINIVKVYPSRMVVEKYELDALPKTILFD